MHYTIIELHNQQQAQIANKEPVYITSLCKQTCEILNKVIKTHPHLVKRSCFVYVGANKSNYGINTEGWHCITITPDNILSLEENVRDIICKLIISNIQDLINSVNSDSKTLIKFDGNL